MNERSEESARTTYQQEYYRQHRAELKDRAKKLHAANQPHVSDEELERLRIPENLPESLLYGVEEKTVCLWCGRIGDNLSRHTRGCRVKPQSSSQYKEHWGFDRSNPLTSPKQRQAYSRSQRQSQTFERRRESARKQLPAARAARTGARRGPMRLESKLKRRGKRIGARPRLQKVPDRKVLEVFMRDLPLAERAKCLGLSQTAAYRREQRLGLDTGAPRRQQQRILRLVFNVREWIVSRSTTPTIEQVTQHYMDELRSGSVRPSRELSSFLTHLETELRARPEWITEIAAERANKALASKTFTLGIRVYRQLRNANARTLDMANAGLPTVRAARAKGGRRPGMSADRIREAQQLESWIERFGGERGAIKKAAAKVYPELDSSLRYDRARQTLKDYRKRNREKN